MNIYGYLWISMNLYGYLWISVNICESLWIFVDIYESLWISVDISENLWISMNIYEYLCTQNHPDTPRSPQPLGWYLQSWGIPRLFRLLESLDAWKYLESAVSFCFKGLMSGFYSKNQGKLYGKCMKMSCKFSLQPSLGLACADNSFPSNISNIVQPSCANCLLVTSKPQLLPLGKMGPSKNAARKAWKATGKNWLELWLSETVPNPSHWYSARNLSWSLQDLLSRAL